MRKNALIIFTRVPIAGQTKTRLMPVFTGEECADLHICFLQDIFEKSKQTEADIFVFYTPVDQEEKLKNILGEEAIYHPQRGTDLGEKMRNAIQFTLLLGYEKSVLIGSDCPQIEGVSLEDSFETLNDHDIVIHPTMDGGYYLIGMKKDYESIWKIRRYGTNSVIRDTLFCMEKEKLKVFVGKTYYDIDEPEDLKNLYEDLKSNIITNCPRTARYLEQNLQIKMESIDGNRENE